MAYYYSSGNCGGCCDGSGGRGHGNGKKKSCCPGRRQINKKRARLIGVALIALGILIICILFLPLQGWLILFALTAIALGVYMFI